MEPRRRGRGRPGCRRVDRLVPSRITERDVDVRRQRHLARRLAVEPQPPAPLAERLEELYWTEPLPFPQATRRARERFPRVTVVEPLDEQHLYLAARRTPQPEPCRNDPRVVDDQQLRAQLARKIGERAVPDLAARAPVDEKP